MKLEIDNNKIVVFTGSGISAPSGISTFNSANGLWNDHSIYDVCTVGGFELNPAKVTTFYNDLKLLIGRAVPNAAHLAIAELANHYNVVVITTNLDNLHELAGSQVIHLHGDLSKAKSHFNTSSKIDVGDRLLEIGERCDDGGLMRHDVVFYGEQPENIDLARMHIKTACKVLVVGSSLTVKPSSTLLKHARGRAEKVLIVDEPNHNKPYGFKQMLGDASKLVPNIVNK
ncbi:NAD-dependent deacylase [Photobacterium leiognathi]|uniref:SIR2 family NAD-dependent protein deacylase n=1 Tax=Photobacterium leiognathi TaxID=553611 RepID=UPI001EE14B50|nr:Sir2 family NAD-dependent protein deacetylase [Photobacterium leiognathi]MCG3884446.1 NAD-dependent deacylase [Photobacterium leiognathi]